MGPSEGGVTFVAFPSRAMVLYSGLTVSETASADAIAAVQKRLLAGVSQGKEAKGVGQWTRSYGNTFQS